VFLCSMLCIVADVLKFLGETEERSSVTEKKFAIKTSPRKSLGGGRRRCSMTFEEEREFLAPWVGKAASGGILTVPPIHAALIKSLGLCGPLRQDKFSPK